MRLVRKLLPDRRRLRRWAITGFGGTVVVILSAYVLTSCIVGPYESRLSLQSLSIRAAARPDARQSLRVVTLNVAHGRRDGVHQLLQSEDTIRDHLDETAAALARVDADVVALQEADGPSFWSGSFDHVHHLAERSAFPQFVRGDHVRGFGLSYGTAILSRLAIDDAWSYTFEPSPPTFSKGFVIATVRWPRAPGDLLVDIVSLHLDFARSSVRKQQIREVVARLSGRRRPRVVLGDFNCDWSDGSAVHDLARELNLAAYQPEDDGLATFPLTGRRFDWILLSPELRFRSLKVLPDVLSDHRAVVADIQLTTRGAE